MKPIEELKAGTIFAYDMVKVELVTLQDMVQYKGYEDYSVIAHSNWDSVIINIEHKVFNWTNFLTVTVKGDDFDFSHGSGGFNNSTVSERLKATKDMFEIVTLLQTDVEKIETQRIVISKLDTILATIKDTYRNAQKNEALEIAYTDIAQEHTEISSEDILATIKSGGSVFVYSINCNHDFKVEVQKNEVENRAMSGARANFYFQDFKYSKKDLLSALSTRRFFVED